MISRDKYFILQDADGQHYLYAPLSDYFVKTDYDSVDKLPAEALEAIPQQERKVLWTNHTPDALTNLMVLPNHKCNFHCSYCFSAKGRSNEELAPETLHTVVSYFFSPERLGGRKATLSILGGGEPLISWPLVKQAVLWAEATYEGPRPLRISIVTNCSLIDDEFIAFCKEHQIYVTASFDILEDLQNRQRAQYQRVLGNIIALTREGIPVDITAVITKDSIHRQREMVEHVAATVPRVSRLSFRYLLSDTYFRDSDDRDSYYKAFIDNYFLARERAQQLGITLTCPYENLMAFPVDRHCPGKFVLTPSGAISTCFCVSSPKEAQFDKFIFGKVEQGTRLTLDEQKLDAILSCDNNSRDECRHCPARWHCAGGCYSDNHFMTPDERASYCRSMVYFLTQYLIKTHKECTGNTI